MEPAPAPRRLGALLVSPKLALALLVVILGCCVTGVTLVRGARAGELIFGTLWFNALLVLLAVSSFVAFAGRIWSRKLTLVSAGMIVFHLSFAGLLVGIVHNQLFFFRGVLRLTEGERLANGDRGSYDAAEHGRLFDFRRLRGETTLVKMHRDYEVDGKNKRTAYEVEIGEGQARRRSVIYVTEFLSVDGVRYFSMKEGYSVLLVMADAAGRERFGAFVPLQSYRRSKAAYRYAVGNPTEEFPFAFPPHAPRADVRMSYRPSSVTERTGEVELEVAPLLPDGKPGPARSGRVVVGAPFDAGDFTLTPREIRYWVAMSVNHDPGMPVMLGSLCAGLAGMVLTLAGRLRRGVARGHRGVEPLGPRPATLRG